MRGGGKSDKVMCSERTDSISKTDFQLTLQKKDWKDQFYTFHKDLLFSDLFSDSYSIMIGTCLAHIQPFQKWQEKYFLVKHIAKIEDDIKRLHC